MKLRFFFKSAMQHMHRSIYIVFFSILIANVQAAPSALAKEYRIITAEYETFPGDKNNEDPSVTDFYLNAGQKNGVEAGMLFDVYRPKLIIDSVTLEKKNIRILIGKVKVINVNDDISIARIDSLEPLSSNPIVNYRTVMIGDYLTEAIKQSKKPEPEVSEKKPTPEVPSKVKMIIPADILFAYNSWKLKPEASSALKKIAEHITSPDVILFIEGYTSSRGRKDYNLRLSRKRAESAATYLKTLKDIPEKQLIIMGYGAEFPVAPNDTEENRAKNRRVEFKIIPANQVSFVK